MEANNDHEIDDLLAPTKPRSDKQNATATSNLENDKPSSLPAQVHNNDGNNMVLHQQPPAVHHWTPLVAETQQIVQQEALNGKFLTWLQQKYPGALLCHVKRAENGRQDLAHMAPLLILRNREFCVEFLDERLRVPGNVNILQKSLFTVLTSSDNPPLLHDINSTPLDWKTLFTDDTTRHQTPFHAQQGALNGVSATCESALGGATYQLQQFGRIRIRHQSDNFDITGAPGDAPSKSALLSATYQNC